jgi:hypothetical protein
VKRPHITKLHGLWYCMGDGLLANGLTKERAYDFWRQRREMQRERALTMWRNWLRDAAQHTTPAKPDTSRCVAA